MEVEMMIKSV